MPTQMRGVHRTRALSTGSAEIDKKLGGGIPSSSLTLVEGESDSGKSVFVQQLIWGSLRQGLHVSIFTTENTVRSFFRQTDALNLSVIDYWLLKRLRVHSINVMQVGDSLEKALASLAESIAGQGGQNLVVIDSVTSFIAHSSSEQTLSFFERSKALCNEGQTIVCVAHSYAFDPTTVIRIGSMCDGHLRLATETVGEKIIRRLEVAKIRGAQQSTGNIISFDVEPGWGMRIIPFTKARA